MKGREVNRSHATFLQGSFQHFLSNRKGKPDFAIEAHKDNANYLADTYFKDTLRVGL